MDSLANDFAAGIICGAPSPCLSLYQPTHRSHPENRQDTIRFRNLVRTIEESLQQKYSSCDVISLLESRKGIRLLDGNRDVLDEVELDPAMPRTITDVLGTDLKESHARVWTHGSGASTAGCARGWTRDRM